MKSFIAQGGASVPASRALLGSLIGSARPTTVWLAIFAAIILSTAFTATAQTANTLSNAEIEGRALAQKIRSQVPLENFTNTGILKIKNAKGVRLEIPVKSDIIVTATNWSISYAAKFGSNATDITTLVVTHSESGSDSYLLFEDDKSSKAGIANIHLGTILKGEETMASFAGSDFWLADLGLEFFHWPQQKVLKKGLRSSRAYTLLESTNPHPVPGGYSRVESWIDNESLGIMEANAYDTNGKQLKNFQPKDIKKINGQWQVLTVIMENVQTGGRSRLEFDPKK